MRGLSFELVSVAGEVRADSHSNFALPATDVTLFEFACSLTDSISLQLWGNLWDVRSGRESGVAMYKPKLFRLWHKQLYAPLHYCTTLVIHECVPT